MKIKVYTLNAFGKDGQGGNPAGLVLDADDLSPDQMTKIASIVGFSETAFLMKSDQADYKLRFFTPSEEVDLCGHATIASFYAMAELNLIQAGKYKQETKAGILDIEIRDDHTIYMSQNPPKFYGEVDRASIAKSLNISEEAISSDLPIEIVSTGLKDIIVPLKNLDSLLAIEPDFDEISQISRETGAVGYHIFTLETKLDSIAHSRNFAPLYAIDEESATGTATAALASYMFKHQLLSDMDLEDLSFEQGYSMNMPSEIRASLSVSGDRIKEVLVGGKGSNLQEIFVEI